MKRHMLFRVIVFLLLVTSLFAFRIREVNCAPWINKYAAKKYTYAENETVPLPNSNYYMSGYGNLFGYYMRIVSTELVEINTLLNQFNMTLTDLEQLSAFGSYTGLSDYTHVVIVTADFWNRDFAVNQNYYVAMDNFLLVGTDYCITPSTDAVTLIRSFNPELDGASNFAIASDRVLTVKIPFLIDTKSEQAISIDYLIRSEPKLLVSFYPDEIYIELPTIRQ